jgi:hypothetical protein
MLRTEQDSPARRELRDGTGRGAGTKQSKRLCRRKIEEAELAPPGCAVEIVIVLRGEVNRQLVVNCILSQPLESGLRRVFRCRICVAGCFDMHYERTVSRQIHGLFRHNYLSVEARAEINHRDAITLQRLCQNHCEMAAHGGYTRATAAFCQTPGISRSVYLHADQPDAQKTRM